METNHFNVLLYDFYRETHESYDVLPYFRRCWEAKEFDSNKVETIKDLEMWIQRASRYNFWARCEYEFIMLPWPYIEDKIFEHMHKVDVHEQVMMNVKVIAMVLAQEFYIK